MTARRAIQYVLDAAARHPQRPALWVDGNTYSYASLLAHAQRLAGHLRRIDGPVCATLGERSLTAYCAPLACMLAGKIHVPLGASFPQARMLDILIRTEPAGLIVDAASSAQAQALSARLASRLCLITPELWCEDAHEVQAPTATQGHASAPDAHAISEAASASGLPVRDDGIAYVLFTSGSTGHPKGVAVGHAALCAYVDAVLERYPELDARQRCTQFFDPTFDLSMHDMFVTWAAGACLYSVPRTALTMPTDFVNAHRLTVWFSVPSLAATLQRYRLLTGGALASLRLALFCGEALPGPLAHAFQAAAPLARCENIYGPTEATIACTGHAIEPESAQPAIVPIGRAFSGMEIAVMDASGQPCEDGTAGELWLGGAQLALGYWRDPLQSAERFVDSALAGRRARRWYRTGDLARTDADGITHYLGRLDRQIKLRGYRVELQEIESHLRTACAGGAEPAEIAVVAIASGPGEPATGLAAFVVQAGFDAAHARAEMKRRVPAYMVPDQFHTLDAMPLNSNGKIDYPALAAQVRRTLPTARERTRSGMTMETPQ